MEARSILRAARPTVSGAARPRRGSPASPPAACPRRVRVARRYGADFSANTRECAARLAFAAQALDIRQRRALSPDSDRFGELAHVVTVHTARRRVRTRTAVRPAQQQVQFLISGCGSRLPPTQSARNCSVSWRRVSGAPSGRRSIPVAVRARPEDVYHRSLRSSAPNQAEFCPVRSSRGRSPRRRYRARFGAECRDCLRAFSAGPTRRDAQPISRLSPKATCSRRAPVRPTKVRSASTIRSVKPAERARARMASAASNDSSGSSPDDIQRRGCRARWESSCSRRSCVIRRRPRSVLLPLPPAG